MQAKMFEDGSQTFDMLLLDTRIDENIAKVYQTSRVVQLSQIVSHQMLKSS